MLYPVLGAQHSVCFSRVTLHSSDKKLGAIFYAHEQVLHLERFEKKRMYDTLDEAVCETCVISSRSCVEYQHVWTTIDAAFSMRVMVWLQASSNNRQERCTLVESTSEHKFNLDGHELHWKYEACGRRVVMQIAMSLLTAVLTKVRDDAGCCTLHRSAVHSGYHRDPEVKGSCARY